MRVSLNGSSDGGFQMSVLGGDQDPIKRAARDLAYSAKQAAEFVGGLAVVSAAAAPQIATPLLVSAAGLRVFAMSQDRVADDPVRHDWMVYAPPLPAALRDPLLLRDEPATMHEWNAALFAMSYSVEAALVSAERLAGLRLANSIGRGMAQIDPSVVGAAQRAVGKLHLSTARACWFRLRSSGAPYPTLRLLLELVPELAQGPRAVGAGEMQDDERSLLASEATRLATNEFSLRKSDWRTLAGSRKLLRQALREPAPSGEMTLNEVLLLGDERGRDRVIRRSYDDLFLQSTAWGAFT